MCQAVGVHAAQGGRRGRVAEQRRGGAADDLEEAVTNHQPQHALQAALVQACIAQGVSKGTPDPKSHAFLVYVNYYYPKP